MSAPFLYGIEKQMDDLAKFNKERWEALARANVVFSRPFLDLDETAARQVVDPPGILDNVAGKEVLCLAGGGGQQSAAFALLGANVTIFDLSETQLQRDRDAAKHYGFKIKTVQGDMRDLSCFEPGQFDVIWHAYSINFVPQYRPILEQVARILKPGGYYRIEFANPFSVNLDEGDWNGVGYPLTQPYIDGAELVFLEPLWDVENEDGTNQKIEGPKEFRHTLSTVLNLLVECGFILLHTSEELSNAPDAEPGSWEHFKSIAPPWLTFWAVFRPDVFQQIIPNV